MTPSWTLGLVVVGLSLAVFVVGALAAPTRWYGRVLLIVLQPVMAVSYGVLVEGASETQCGALLAAVGWAGRGNYISMYCLDLGLLMAFAHAVVLGGLGLALLGWRFASPTVERSERRSVDREGPADGP